MTTAANLKRVIVTTIAVLAAAPVFGLVAEPARAWARFSDHSVAQVRLGCHANLLGMRRMQGAAQTIDGLGRPTAFEVWVGNPASGYQLIFSRWVEDSSYTLYTGGAIIHDFTGPVMARWVYVRYSRFVNGRLEQYAEWLPVNVGTQLFPYCYL
jgi:hypothetical protein